MDLTAEELLMKPYKKGAKPEDIILGGDTILKLIEQYGEMKWKQACKLQREACKDKVYDLLYNDGDAETWAEKVAKTKLVEYDNEPEYD